MKGKLLVAVILLTVCTAAPAIPVQITDRAALQANDYVDWGVFGPAFTLVPSGAQVSTAGGNHATVSNSVEPQTPFRVFQEYPPMAPVGWWFGNFGPGDLVLAPNGRPGATLITFSEPVSAAGAQIQGSGRNRPFTAVLDVTDIHGITYTFTADGVSTDAANNSAPFIGVRDDIASIICLQFSIRGGLSTDNGPGINRLDIRASAVPLPGAAVLFVSAVAGLWVPSRRRLAGNR